MAQTTVHFLLHLTIHPDKREDFERVLREMIAATQPETGALGYDWYIDQAGSQCRLMETYADSAAVLTHLEGRAVQELVPKMMQAASIDRFEVYGPVDAEATAILLTKEAKIFAAWHTLRN